VGKDELTKENSSRRGRIFQAGMEADGIKPMDDPKAGS
jgi:hypothetical protein